MLHPSQALTGHNDCVTSVAFSRNGKQIVSGLYDKTICVWDAETLQQISQPLTGHSDCVTSVAFSPNGKQIVSGSDDTTVYVWDAETLQQIGQPLIGHSDWVTSVAFSPNGKQIVSGSHDKTICVWDAETLLNHCNTIFSSLFNSHSYLSPAHKISDNHWILGINEEPLFWIPLRLFDLFPHSFLLGIVSFSSLYHFDNSHFVHGEQWEKCLSII